MPAPIDLAGKVFGKLTVIRLAPPGKRKDRYWECRCQCGNVSIHTGADLRSGRTNSCGCSRWDHLPSVRAARKNQHGLSGTRLFRTWGGMRRRCYNKNNPDYPHYGGRGITICAEWLDFPTFFTWALSHGYKGGLTIERTDVDGNYEPANCSWIPFADQMKNRRCCHAYKKRNL